MPFLTFAYFSRGNVVIRDSNPYFYVQSCATILAPQFTPMKDLDFKIQLKAGESKTALAFVLAYNKQFENHRFIWSTGREVTRKGFDPARPGAALKRSLKIAADAYESLILDGSPMNNTTLKARIELLRDLITWNVNDLSIWNGKTIERYTLPDGFNTSLLHDQLNAELLKHKPDFKKCIDRVLTQGANSLFGFWQAVLDGKIKPRAGKTLRKSTLKTKRQALILVKEFDSTASFEKMDMRFYNSFTGWMADQKVSEKQEDGSFKIVPRFDRNTIGRMIKDLKAILHLAYRNELLNNDRFKYWPVTNEKNEVVTLDKEEVLKINSLDLSGTKEDVRDIFILACFLGPRISDFKSFKKESLQTTSGITFFEYVQEKTGARVKIPVHPIALEILNKRGGEFPKMISEQNFRYALKDICEAAELYDRVVIKIRDGKPEYKKKCEAISPHSARRTFASNLFFGWFGKPMPAALAMRFTGHKTEKSFLLYIGAKERDLDAKALEYFDVQPIMKVS